MRIFYTDTLRWARRTNRTGLVDDLIAIGPPPYDQMLDYETALSHEHEVYPYDRSGNSEGAGGFSENFLVREYTLVEQVHLLAGFMDTFAALYPQLQDIDFRRTATELPVPVFFVQGRTRSRRTPATVPGVVLDTGRTLQGRHLPRHVRSPADVRAARRVHRLHGRHRPRRHRRLRLRPERPAVRSTDEPGRPPRPRPGA